MAKREATHVVEIESGVGEPSFVPLSHGEELSPISIGRAGMWRLEGGQILDVHAFIYFDGASLFLQSADGASPALVDGHAVGNAWSELNAPCRIDVGGVRLRYRSLRDAQAVGPAGGPAPGQGDTVAMARAPVEPPRPLDSDQAITNRAGSAPPKPAGAGFIDVARAKLENAERPFRPGAFAPPRDDGESTRVAPLEASGSRPALTGPMASPRPAAGRPADEDVSTTHPRAPVQPGADAEASSKGDATVAMAAPLVGYTPPPPMVQGVVALGPAAAAGMAPPAHSSGGLPAHASGPYPQMPPQMPPPGAPQGYPPGAYGHGIPPGMGPPPAGAPPSGAAPELALKDDPSRRRKLLAFVVILLGGAFLLLDEDPPPPKKRPTAARDAGLDGAQSAAAAVASPSAAPPPSAAVSGAPASSSASAPELPILDAGPETGAAPLASSEPPRGKNHKTQERQAVDDVAAGEYARAAAIYERLASQHPENAAYTEALRILRLRLDAGAR